MLTRAAFENFRVLKGVTVDLAPFTVLVGPNGAGRTSVLRGVDMVCRLREPQAGEVVRGLGRPAILLGEPKDLMSWRTGGSSAPWRVVVSGDGGVVGLEVRDAGEGWRFRLRADDRVGIFPPLQSPADTMVYEAPALANLPRPLLLQPTARALAAPSYVEGDVPSVASDGSGLASVLTHLAGNDPDRFQAIQDALRAVVPGVRRVRTPRAKVVVHTKETIEWDGNRLARDVPREMWGNAIQIDIGPHGAIDADATSEGTLIALALLTVLHDPAGPTLVLIDDLASTLHPKAQADLIAAIRKVQALRPGLQVIATSHSPYLIDHMDPSEVRVMGIAADGYARCLPLTQHPRYERLSRGLGAGEFWAAVGEDWTGGDPDAA